MENKQRTLFSWLLLGLLAALCCALAFLQYRWIGAISLAEQDRLEDSLKASLQRMSGDFNAELSAAASALAPSEEAVEEAGLEPAYAARFNQWKAAAAHPEMFRRLVLAVPQNGALILRQMNPGPGTYSDLAWPQEWLALRDWMQERLEGAPRGRGGFRGGRAPVEESLLLDLPRFGPDGPRERNWLIAEVDAAQIGKMVPELLDRHLGAATHSQFQAQVSYFDQGSRILFQSDQGQALIGKDADASVPFFEARAGPGPRPMGPDGGHGRLLLSLRHRTGSLDEVVVRHRWRNLGVSAAIILLMAVSAAMLFRFSRQAQQLADLQMQFVAGVSHELRTPLTVIRTAAYNLRGKIAANPSQVERYGSLIQNESEKLTAIVEQVLRFAGAKAGQVIRERTPVPVQDVIEDAILACRNLFEGNRYQLEKEVAPDLPLIMGDSMALQHALQNLIHNAVKYGTEGNNWIGVSASAPDEETVEIRIADRGPGIPAEEQAQIFEPFFRGKRAVQDQIHGTGLGLNLVKQIVEAHGGTIRVESETMKGTAFVIRLPIAPAEHQDEFANTISRG